MLSEDRKKEFAVFETSEKVAKELVSLVNPRPGDKGLEPSCGSGRVVRALLAAGVQDIRCYDIRKEACAAVEKLGEQVVATEHDFLEVEPDPIYDIVVMNPPFTRGADLEHVAHAFKFLKKGGRLAAITLARKEEKVIAALGDTCGGFIAITPLPELSFEEEGTRVSTQIVYAEKVHDEEDTRRFRHEDDEPRFRRPDVKTSAPMTSISVPGIIGIIDNILMLLRKVDDAVLEVQDAVRELQAQYVPMTGLKDCGLGFDARFGMAEFWNPSRQTHVDNEYELRKLAWSIALTKTQVWTVMDAEEKKRFCEAMASKKTCPAFTPEIVQPTLDRLRSQADLFFLRGLEKVFTSLSHDYKTNCFYRLESKLVVTGVVEQLHCGCPRSRYSYGNMCHLNDLYNVMYLLDGKPEPDYQNSLEGKANEFWENQRCYCDYEDEYLKMRPYKNGNVHVTLKRADLVAAMNEAMGNKLPLAKRPKGKHE